MRHIRITENLNYPLPHLVAARGSAFEAEVLGVPDGADRVQIHFGGVDGSNDYTAVECDAKPGGAWRAYASGAVFPAEGEARYYVSALDGRGNSVGYGWGRLTVQPSILTTEESATGLPEDTFVRGANGLYYPITVEIDEAGVPTVVVGEGVTK